MKSTLSLIFILSIIYQLTGQISLQNPHTQLPTATAPSAPTLRDLRVAEQQRIQQQKEAAMRVHMGNTQSREQHLQEIQAELRQQERQERPVSYEFPENESTSTQYFKQSFAELQDILDGKQDLSLKRAVFLSENAYVDNSMNYELFCSDIKMELDIFQSFMKKEKLDINSDIAKKYMLQKFFSDTLTLKDEKGNIQLTHYPFKYDFDDPFGKKDYRKMFVTKLLRDKKGQCHSLPLLYLIFAEELGIKAWLAYSPQHSYIKTQDGKGNWYNFETTNGQYSSDSWVLGSGFIKAEALKNKIYMDTLSQKETIASCLVDLSMAYVAKFGFNKFVLNCTDKALQYNSKNIFAMQLKSDYYTYLFQYVAKQLGYPPKEQIHLYPQAYSLLQKTYEYYSLVEKSGYEDMPENMYQAWLKSFEKEKGKQPIKIIKP